MDKQIDLFGTPARKLHRRGGPDTSEAAAYSIDSTRLERMVFMAIERYGRNGCIQSDLLREFPYHAYSSITARFKALDEKGMIVRGPDRRPGKSRRMQQVMRSKQHADQIEGATAGDVRGQGRQVDPGHTAIGRR